MQPHRIVSKREWLERRRDLLRREKAFSRLGEELDRQRRNLPWVQVGRNCLFESPTGRRSFGQLFGSRRQLLVYHFMLGPDEACPRCSYLANRFDAAAIHLAQRNISLLAVSRVSLARIAEFKQRMDWQFPWVSSHGSGFEDEQHGASAFYRDEWGDIFLTYSSTAHELDLLIGANHWMDPAEHGRDADSRSFARPPVHHPDCYEARDSARCAIIR